MLVKIKDGLLWFGLWLLLSILAGVTLFQVYNTILVAGGALMESSWRPLYWNFTRLKWLARFLSFVLGTCFVFFLSLAESMMSTWHKRGTLVPSALRMVGGLVLTSLVLLGIAQLLVLFYPTIG